MPSKGQPNPMLDTGDMAMEMTDKATPLVEFKGRGENKEREGSKGGVIRVDGADVGSSESSEKDSSPLPGNQGRLPGGGDPEAETQKTS